MCLELEIDEGLHFCGDELVGYEYCQAYCDGHEPKWHACEEDSVASF